MQLVILTCLIFVTGATLSLTAMVVAASPPLIPQTTTNQSAVTKNATFGLTQQDLFRGGVLLNSGKYNESITYFDKALSINPNSVDALTGKGLAIGGLGKNNESITYFDKALPINPNSVGALTGKGLVLSKLGKHNEAITYFDKALSINPKYPAVVQEREMALAAANSTLVKKP